MYFWTEERIRQLSAFALQGLSAGQIAKELGCSRNAVVGKAHRLGLRIGVGRHPTLTEVVEDLTRKLDSGEFVTLAQQHGEARRKREAKKEAKLRQVKRSSLTGAWTGGFYPAPDTPWKPPEDWNPLPRVGLMELKQGQCRYVCGRGDDGLAMYCGEPTLANKAWCQSCYRAVYKLDAA